MPDRRLPRGAVSAVGVVGLVLLVVASRADTYWQSLLINLGTGALLFVALDYVLYGAVARVTTLVSDALHAFSDEPGIEWVSWAEKLSIDELRSVQRELQSKTPLTTEKLDQLQSELAAVEQMNVGEQVKRMSYLSVLADKYGVQPLRRVIASRADASAG